MVVNEACAAGTPVITCGSTAVDGELVRDKVNGRVLPLEAAQWAEAARELLDSEDTWNASSRAARTLVSPFTYEQAAQGIIRAIRYVASRTAGVPSDP